MYLSFVYSILLFFYAVFLPGFLAYKRTNKNASNEGTIIGLSLGIISIPLIAFSIAWLSGTIVSKSLLFYVATAINLSLILIPKKNMGEIINKPNHQLFILITSCVVFLVYFIIYAGPTIDYWDTYITAPAMFISNYPINFTYMNGTQMYNYTLAGRIPDNLIDNNTYGIITKDQRLGAGITYSIPFLLFGLAGLRTMYALTYSLIFLLSFVLLRKFISNRVVCWAMALFVVFNPYIAAINRINPNVLSLLITTLLFVLISEEKKNWLIIGLVYGILGGIRYEALIFSPTFIFFWLYKKDTSNADILKFFFAAFVVIFPFLLWNKLAFGGFFVHPSQYSNFEGFRPTFEHTFLWLKFQFNGLLNFPFHNEIIRTPHFAFPTIIMIPLVIIRTFGLILSSIFLFGTFQVLKKSRKECLFFGLWSIILFIFLAFQENWDEFKMTYILFMFPFIVLCISKGIESIIMGKEKKKIAAIIVVLIISILIIIKSLNFVEIMPDARWYERFPHAAIPDSKLPYLDNNHRMSWEFFHVSETSTEIKEQKQIILSPGLVPNFYLPIKMDTAGFNKAIKEINKKDLTAVGIWEYIYG